MKKYEAPEIEVIELSKDDIIRTSPTQGGGSSGSDAETGGGLDELD